MITHQSNLHTKSYTLHMSSSSASGGVFVVCFACCIHRHSYIYIYLDNSVESLSQLHGKFDATLSARIRFDKRWSIIDCCCCNSLRLTVRANSDAQIFHSIARSLLIIVFHVLLLRGDYRFSSSALKVIWFVHCEAIKVQAKMGMTCDGIGQKSRYAEIHTHIYLGFNFRRFALHTTNDYIYRYHEWLYVKAIIFFYFISLLLLHLHFNLRSKQVFVRQSKLFTL